MSWSAWMLLTARDELSLPLKGSLTARVTAFIGPVLVIPVTVNGTWEPVITTFQSSRLRVPAFQNHSGWFSGMQLLMIKRTTKVELCLVPFLCITRYLCLLCTPLYSVGVMGAHTCMWTNGPRTEDTLGDTAHLVCFSRDLLIRAWASLPHVF